MRTPQGITPPAPGLDREEPTFVPEQDIPSSERRPAADAGRPREERPASRSPERE
ncbi:MAG TPA: hypothetical protein VGD76_17020 [Ramlibacter sp.]